MHYRNRLEAGRQLSELLGTYKGRGNVVVVGLARGGVPVAAEVARRLGTPLDVLIVRKLGAPGQEELAMGAIASGGIRILNREVIGLLHISSEDLEAAVVREEAELQRREELYRAGKPPLEVAGKTVIVVDDGLATGATMRAAVAALRQHHVAEVVVAVPVAAEESCRDLTRDADAVICAATPKPFYAVGAWYEDFGQTTDTEVRELIESART